MQVSPLAGKQLPPSALVNIPRLVTAYYAERPDASVAAQRVAFGTSGHRGSAFDRTFNETHILAITQAICRLRKERGIDGPLFMGMDSHALSEPAFVSAIEVLAANGVDVMIDRDRGCTPTPVISHAILTYNRGRRRGMADGIVITPSHNPPDEGGFKYDPPNGGPAGLDVTRWIERAANDMIADDLRGVTRTSYERAVGASTTHRHDYVNAYVADLASAIDLDAVAAAGVRIGVDALGGAGARYWGPIVERYGLSMTVFNDVVDPTFRFMAADRDGKIRMDCSSPYAMAPVVAMRDKFDITFANDTDADRHGIVTPSAGLMNPNQYLAAAISYLVQHRPDWPAVAAIGKTVVSSGMIDRVTAGSGRKLFEVPVGFKWFVDGLLDGTLCFGGEESAGASLLRRDGTVWTTDKDGIVFGLLAAEMTARLGQDPGRSYEDLTRKYGASFYERTDVPASATQKSRLAKLSPEQVRSDDLAGDAIRAVQMKAPGNAEPIGGIKVITDQGWFAARPSGTEDVYKIYAESFRSAEHLKAIQEEAEAIVAAALQ